MPKELSKKLKLIFDLVNHRGASIVTSAQDLIDEDSDWFIIKY